MIEFMEIGIILLVFGGAILSGVACLARRQCILDRKGLTMRDVSDHYREDGFKNVKPLSSGNVFMAVFLVMILGIAIFDVWTNRTSKPIELKQEQVIPWSPHPKQAR